MLSSAYQRHDNKFDSAVEQLALYLHTALVFDVLCVQNSPSNNHNKCNEMENV